MQLCFVSVHGPRETYFVDEPRIECYATNRILSFAQRVSLPHSDSHHANVFYIYFVFCVFVSVGDSLLGFICVVWGYAVA
jgi:hypothetical protein